MFDVVQDTFNIGSGGTYSVNRLCELLGREITHIPKRPGESDCTSVDTIKIENKLGWKANLIFEEGVQKVLDNINYWRKLWYGHRIVSVWLQKIGLNTSENNVEKAKGKLS